MGKSICSICGCDKRSGHCEHIAGREYKGRSAYTILSDVKDAYEFSFVAVPAQREAGVTKAFKTVKGDTDMKSIIKSLQECTGGITLSKAQVNELLNHMDTLDEEAALGREYKKGLIKEVVGLCAKAMPDMDLNTFSGVAQVMTTKELLSFKKAFTKTKNCDGVTLQLKPQCTDKSENTYSNYKI